MHKYIRTCAFTRTDAAGLLVALEDQSGDVAVTTLSTVWNRRSNKQTFSTLEEMSIT
jgi:hypothetical protein